jgi:DNA-binding XRE family transcriptional regulator
MPLFRDTPELLLAFREGKPAALERVYRFYVRPMDIYFRAMARFAHTPELAQPSAIADLLQEIFMRADAIRKRRKEILIGPGDLPLTAEDAPPEDEMYDPKVLAVLDAYLKQLPAELKGVYQQRFVLGLSQDQACKTLSVSRRTLRTAEEHLRRGLRKALLLAGVLHGSPALAPNPLQESRP